jgi:hypothetical protein
MNTQSQRNTLLEAFKRNETLSARISAKKYNIDTFSQRIKDIECMGYVVNRAWVYIDGIKSHKEYWVSQDQFKQSA